MESVSTENLPGSQLGWYRCNRQYVQASGKLVLKLSGFRATAPPHLHRFHGHGAFSSRRRCLATSATKTHTEEEKGHGRRGWVFLGEQRGLGHCMLCPCLLTALWKLYQSDQEPTLTQKMACESFSSSSLGMQLSSAGCLPVRVSQGTKLWLADGGAGCQGTRDPAAGQCTVDEGRHH